MLQIFSYWDLNGFPTENSSSPTLQPSYTLEKVHFDILHIIIVKFWIFHRFHSLHPPPLTPTKKILSDSWSTPSKTYISTYHTLLWSNFEFFTPFTPSPLTPTKKILSNSYFATPKTWGRILLYHCFRIHCKFLNYSRFEGAQCSQPTVRPRRPDNASAFPGKTMMAHYHLSSISTVAKNWCQFVH